jgi:hypothetical protein
MPVPIPGPPRLLVTPDELREHPAAAGKSDTELSLACRTATGAITGYTRQTIALATHTHVLPIKVDTDPIRGTMQCIARLPQRPVRDVLTVTVDGQPCSFVWQSTSATLWLPVETFGQEAAVTYEAGWSPIPDDIAAVAFSMAVQELTNPNGVEAERLADYSVTYGKGDSTGLTGRQTVILDAYRTQAHTITPS